MYGFTVFYNQFGREVQKNTIDVASMAPVATRPDDPQSDKPRDGVDLSLWIA
jgi:hypothetical protein